MPLPENLHVNIPESERHNPAKFESATIGTYMRKGLDGSLIWDVEQWKKPISGLVDMSLTPPAEADGLRFAIVELTGTAVNSAWDGATKNSIVEYDLSSSVWNSVEPSGAEVLFDSSTSLQYYFDGSTSTWTSLGGSGGITATGTPVDNQVAVFDSDSSIEGHAGFLYDSAKTELTLVDGNESTVIDFDSIIMTGEGGDVDLNMRTYGTGVFPTLGSYVARGTVASPTAIQSGDDLYRHNFFGHNGAGSFSGGNIIIEATENWSGTSRGTSFTIGTEANGGTGVVDRFKIDGAGDITLGNFKFDGDQTVGAGQDDYVLTYDHSAGTIGLEASAGGSSAWSELTTPDRLFYDDIVTIGDDNHTWSGTPTNGFLAVGSFNTIDAVQRGAIFGSSNTVGTVATAAAPFISGNSNIVYGGTSNTLLGSSNRTGYGNQNFGAGNVNYVYGNRNIALGDSNQIGTTSVTRNDCITIGDSCYAYGGDHQIMIGKGIQTNTSWATAKGIYFGIDSGRANAGFFKDPLAGSNWPTNFILGNRSAMRTDATGGIQSGTGAGIWYLYNEPTDTNIVEPTANLGNATAMWSKDRVAGVSGLLVKAENGSMSWVGDRIGINVVSSGTATAALTSTIDASLHVFGEGTGTTSGIKHENSSGTVTFETRDDGVIIAANLPTSSAGLPTGALWNNLGIINIV